MTAAKRQVSRSHTLQPLRTRLILGNARLLHTPVADPLKLYVKVWCPWGVMAQDWLDEHGYKYELIDIERSRVRLAGTEQFVPMALRVTTIYRPAAWAYRSLSRGACLLSE